ncbi:MAG: 16S rRNA (guanine(527)-N(7))-methyltransferase RsmG [Candidatus Acidiferrales bacterium]
MAAPLTTSEVAQELADYEVVVSENALGHLVTYQKLLLRWNRRINLTALCTPRRIVRQLFGESLYLTRVLVLRGRLLDVGTGAGFPGLALKIAVPSLDLTLIEANRRKCAFLKEVVRACGLVGVRVVSKRFHEWVAHARGYVADVTTTRAVDVSQNFLELLAQVTAPDGRAVFYTTETLARHIRSTARGWAWLERVHIPNTNAHSLLMARPRRIFIPSIR